LRAPTLVLGYTAIELFSSVFGFRSGVAHLTHLAGFGFAWLYFLVRFGANPWNSSSVAGCRDRTRAGAIFCLLLLTAVSGEAEEVLRIRISADLEAVPRDTWRSGGSGSGGRPARRP
jgi:hypothetical protein